MLVTGQRVRVYWNLHKKMFSVMDAKTGKVVDHVHAIRLNNVEFVVRQAGNRRVRQTGKKNVHAFAVGYVDVYSRARVYEDFDWHLSPYTGITYNPYTDQTFVTKGERRTPVKSATLAYMIGNGVFPVVVAEGVI